MRMRVLLGLLFFFLFHHVSLFVQTFFSGIQFLNTNLKLAAVGKKSTGFERKKSISFEILISCRPMIFRSCVLPGQINIRLFPLQTDYSFGQITLLTSYPSFAHFLAPIHTVTKIFTSI